VASEYGGVERRRLPRVDVAEGTECQLDLRARVRLVDISLSGALLSVDARLPVGARGRLRTGVAAGPFTPVVTIQRCVARPESGQPAIGLGAKFVEIDAGSRQRLAAFLPMATGQRRFHD
jgi:PilZ domain